MSDNNENRRQTRRFSSILKNVGAGSGSDNSPTQTFNRRSKRISFSHVNNIKEFVADGNNRTIWGNSYENTAVEGSSSGSASTINSAATSSTSTLIDLVAPTATIDLFADIDDRSVEDVEMEVSHGDTSRSPTKLFNQTMFIDEESHTATSVITSMTNCRIVDRSTGAVTTTNKRKTVETISVDTVTTDVTKSVKIRRLNDENLEPNIHHGQLVEPKVNLNSTRIFDADADLSDVDCQPQVKTTNPPPAVNHIGSSNVLNKTVITSTDISIDDQSIISTMSDTSKAPVCNKTHIYGRGDFGAGIDQTFAVRNPVMEMPSASKGNDAIDNSQWMQSPTKDNGGTVEPNQQPNSSDSRHRLLDDLTISMDIRFKDHSLTSTNQSLNADEPVIEDLTIMLDTNFKAEVSGEVTDTAINSMTPTNNQSMEKESLMVANRMEAETNADTIVSDHSLPPSERNAPNLTSKTCRDMTFCSVVDVDDGDDVGATCRQRIPSPTFVDVDKPRKTDFFDSFIAHDPIATTTTDFSFGPSEPLSSTRFVPNNKSPLHYSDTAANNNNNKVNSSNNVTFNFGPISTTTMAASKSVASLQNNTDELCNLEPDQLKKRSEMKKMFLSLSHDSNELLCETKMDLVGASSSSIVDVDGSSDEEHQFPSELPNCVHELMSSSQPRISPQSQDNTSVQLKREPSNGKRCLRCMNCRHSMDNATTFLKKDELASPPKLDFSMYDQFKGLASWQDVIDARKAREASKLLEDELSVDQNVDAPDFRFLWLNKVENERPIVSQPMPVPEPLPCHPLRMNIQYLMRNKMRTEYTQWKYNDNFYRAGSIALRNCKIPSIRIHIKFDDDGPAKAEKLNAPLLFTKVFVEQCPTYLRRISPANYLKHKHALARLPINLMTMLPDSETIYHGLDTIDNLFHDVVIAIDEVGALVEEHGAMLQMEFGNCTIERTIFDIRKYVQQDIVIRLDKIDAVGQQNVYFKPSRDTTDEFKALPSGLPFLRAFLADPMAYLLPPSDDGQMCVSLNV